MSEKQFNYEADWRRYAYPVQTTGFASCEELAERYTPVELEQGIRLPQGGLPVYSDGTRAILSTGDDHSIIFGGTASKKTRTLMVPLINILAHARESMVIMDIKGELSDGVSFPSVRGSLEANGYDCRFLNFRDLDGDGCNLLLEPYRLYKAGERDEAVSMVGDIVSSLAAIYAGSKADPFWELTAKQYLTAATILMFELCNEPQKVNMLTLGSYTTETSCDHMVDLANEIEIDNNIMTMLRSVTSEPPKTRMSTLTVANSMLTNFLLNEKLLKMLSTSTFDFRDLGQKPTALFIILPDEVDTYAGVAGLLLQQLSAALVRSAYLAGGKLPVRVNFLCDEFCNYYVPGMMRSISAHRSRNIRWYLVCQSQKQLKACYEKEADTILANCTNLYFLNSSELELLEYLSRRAGTTTVTETGRPEPILSVEDLQSLKKTWTHTDVYFTSGSIHHVSAMPDIDGYPFVAHHKTPCPMPRNTFPGIEIYSAYKMLMDIRRMKQAVQDIKDGKKVFRYEEALAKHYQNLFT